MSVTSELPGVASLADTEEHTSPRMERIREKAAGLGRKVVDVVDSGREGLADGFDGAARRAEQVSGVADRAGDRFESMAKQLRENDTRALLAQLSALVRAHPGKSLVAVAAVGYLAGRALRRS